MNCQTPFEEQVNLARQINEYLTVTLSHFGIDTFIKYRPPTENMKGYWECKFDMGKYHMTDAWIMPENEWKIFCRYKVQYVLLQFHKAVDNDFS
jgi:hypothetical protein